MIPILTFASPANAQLAGSLALDSDYRLRGYSLSNGHPAASLQLSYDDPSGLYLSASGLNELGHGSRFLGVIGNAGYARRLNERITVEAGVLRSQIRAVHGDDLGFKYTEVYAGAFVGPVSGRLYYSPDYRISGQSTLYGEIEGGFEPSRNWRVSGHVGMLTYLNTSLFWRKGETHRDWRVALARQLGRFEVHTSLSHGGPETYYGGKLHNKAAVSLGGSMSF